MPRDKRVDAYIAKAQPFAQPILKHLRELVHHANPDVTETIKWGMPSFEYKGPYFGIASFKKHCVAGFWKSQLLKDPKGYLGLRKAQGGEAMGNLGCIASINDLPPDRVLIDFFRQAKKLNDEGVKVERKQSPKPLVIPAELKSALAKNRKAKAVFDSFSNTNKREYADWIAEARTDVTRQKRLDTAVDWISEGKPRQWKYLQKKKQQVE